MDLKIGSCYRTIQTSPMSYNKDKYFEATFDNGDIFTVVDYETRIKPDWRPVTNQTQHIWTVLHGSRMAYIHAQEGSRLHLEIYRFFQLII